MKQRSVQILWNPVSNKWSVGVNNDHSGNRHWTYLFDKKLRIDARYDAMYLARKMVTKKESVLVITHNKNGDIYVAYRVQHTGISYPVPRKELLAMVEK